MQRGKAKPAVAHSDRGYSMPAGDRQVGVPMDLGIIVSVQVDTARRNDEPAGIQHLFGSAAIQAANFGDLATLDADIRLVAWHACPIDNRTVFNNSVEFGHDFLL